MVYRNYNSSHQKILESTAFEKTADNLKKFLQKVSAQGGWGNQAIEIFMYAVNNEPYPVDQVILIGDAETNTANLVIQKRQTKG